MISFIKLSGIPCGARPTSCPDQLTKGIQAYLEAKGVNVAEKCDIPANKT